MPKSLVGGKSIARKRFKRIGRGAADPEVMPRPKTARGGKPIGRSDINVPFKRISGASALPSAIKAGTAIGAMLYSPGLNVGEEEQLKKFQKEEQQKRKAAAKKKATKKKKLSKRYTGKMKKQVDRRKQKEVTRKKFDASKSVSEVKRKRDAQFKKYLSEKRPQDGKKPVKKEQMTKRQRLEKYNEEFAKRLLERERIKTEIGIRKKIKQHKF